MPPESCASPNDRRGKPAIGSKPMAAISKPMAALTKPLAIEPPPIEAMMVSASMAIAKYSGVPKDRA